MSIPDQPFRRTSLSWRKKTLEVLPWRLGHCGTSQFSCFYSPVCQQGTFCHALFWACILNDKLPGVYNFISSQCNLQPAIILVCLSGKSKKILKLEVKSFGRQVAHLPHNTRNTQGHQPVTPRAGWIPPILLSR